MDDNTIDDHQLDAHPYRGSEGWMVELTMGGLEVDEAGPFDDESEAVDAARRSVYGGGLVY